MLSSGLLLIIALLCAAIGFIVGALVMMLWSGGDKKESKNHKTNDPETLASRYQEVAHLWRDPASGKLLTELRQRVLSGAQSLTLVEREQLEHAAREWVEWLGLPGIQPSQPPAPLRAPEIQAPPPGQPAGSKVEPTPPIPTAPPAVEPAHKSIVAQIDAILQEILANSPLANKGIRLAEEPRQGVVVWIGLTRYASIDTVPDAEVKSAIRAAVAEWERRSESAGR
jgi:hypothetical protein